MINLLKYQDAKDVVVCGDIHGEFNELVYKICMQYQMRDTLVVVAGDCGFGFENKAYYEQMVRKNAKRMNEANNWIVFVRGNHDNPAYFDGVSFNHKRMIAVPDYTVIEACGHTLLCVGGATSMDRSFRIKEWSKRKLHIRQSGKDGELFGRNFYWSDEQPIFNAEKLQEIKQSYKVDVVVTHTAPDFCELFMKDNLNEWAVNDECLLEDVKRERQTMTQLYEQLIADSHPIKDWCYGHFHQSWHSSINGIMFSMLDIMELKTLR